MVVKEHCIEIQTNIEHFLLWTKGSHQRPNVDTFKCSGENLPNSSCHFANHKSFFTQNFITL